ncbi:diguanylate cyclase domain-containing protein [Paraburkholderia phenazinium]|uniref:Diguanylate cyclase (GGDEF) domain-containing protein n=1 Tax=Paraburkholderia phenazinium TaxID=60549 RepID=A0A1G8BML1_9BURK|nr:diguanylate cyclase [Paraburkholderia phenazinium]SDH34324.1 diguanylate cyclase (GGDEF) domain-containing protein [Paraburkholderia phenazinium]
MMRPGLTFKLSLLLACIGVIASGATGYYAYRANRTMLVSEAEQNLLTSTELLGQRFSVAIDDVAADALVLATLPSAAQLAQFDDGSGANPSRERLAKVFASFMANHPEYLQIRLIARQHYGLELIRFDRNGQSAVRVETNRLQEKGQFAYVFDTLALPPRGIYISPIAVNHEHGAHSAEGKPTLRLATPVAADDGSVVGVMVLDVDLASLLKVLQVDLPRDYQVYLANEWGDFLIHPDASQTFGFDRGRRIFMQDSFPATKPIFEQSKSAVLMNGLVRPQQAAGHVLAFIRRPFGAADGNRFIVLGLSKPLSDVLAGANLLGIRIIRMVLVSSVFAFLLAILFARALTQPLQMLAHAATHFFADHTMGALPLRRTDEIGVLARCFDRMRREIRLQLDVLHSKQHELVHLASHDALTGLPNRMLFAQKLETAIDEAAASGERLAVLFVDLDRFKQINDQFGHTVGDRVLATVARRLQAVLSERDMVARLGGDEFIVLIRGSAATDAAPGIAAGIIDSLNETLLIDGQPLVVGASIGISQYPADGTSVEMLLLNADAAMYAAKSGEHASWLRYEDLLEARRRKAGGMAVDERDGDRMEPGSDNLDAVL